jgi:hypothetical protein
MKKQKVKLNINIHPMINHNHLNKVILNAKLRDWKAPIKYNLALAI